MQSNWWVWLIAGHLLNEVVKAGWVPAIFTAAWTVVVSTVTFLGALGAGILLFFTAAAFFLLGRRGAEDGAARFDMNNRWNNRKNYR